MGHYLFLDVGGTGIKSGIFDDNGDMLIPVREYASLSDGLAEDIFCNLSEIIKNTSSQVSLIPTCIGMAFPGPFDYRKGISYMKGIGKYDSIYGLSIPEYIRKYFDESFSNIPMFFIHDVEAFALGVWFHDLDSYNGSMMAVTIGTGCGSAFIRSGKILKSGEDVPENGWIYRLPFKDSIIDDYVSKRGQSRLSMEIFGRDIDGRILDRMASQGDSRAITLFKRFGENLTEALKPFIESFNPDTIVIGGNISGSFRFFGESLQRMSEEYGCRIIHDAYTSERTMEGLWIKSKKGDF